MMIAGIFRMPHGKISKKNHQPLVAKMFLYKYPPKKKYKCPKPQRGLLYLNIGLNDNKSIVGSWICFFVC